MSSEATEEEISFIERAKVQTKALETNDLTNNQACLSVFGFLHTIDPNIVGFEVVTVNDQTEEWEVKTLYNNGAEGRLYGKGIKVHSIVDGGHFDLEPFDQFMQRMAANEEFCDTRLEPREEPDE